jgi:hypothetical protein
VREPSEWHGVGPLSSAREMLGHIARCGSPAADFSAVYGSAPSFSARGGDGTAEAAAVTTARWIWARYQITSGAMAWCVESRTGPGHPAGQCRPNISNRHALLRCERARSIRLFHVKHWSPRLWPSPPRNKWESNGVSSGVRGGDGTHQVFGDKGAVGRRAAD